jgi:hypothetical protein
MFIKLTPGNSLLRPVLNSIGDFRPFCPPADLGSGVLVENRLGRDDGWLHLDFIDVRLERGQAEGQCHETFFSVANGLG